MKITHEDIIKALEEMKLAEINELVQKIQSHFNISLSSLAPSSNEENTKEQTEFDVILVELQEGSSKVAVIKAVAKLLGTGLMAAKKLLDKLPTTLKQKVNSEEGKEIQEQFSALKAKVDLK